MSDESFNPHRMSCMEVWGGNRAFDGGVIMAGLDAWLYSQPWADADAGGDVHLVSSCATGRITRLLLADVSGHGEKVARTADELRTLMRRYVNHIDQGRFVGAVNDAFRDGLRDGLFATAVIATFFAPVNELQVCLAGHPPPLLYRARQGQWSLLAQPGAAGNAPLGILADQAFEQITLRLGVGDVVLFYTDALFEAAAARGGRLGLDGLVEIAGALPSEPAATLMARVRSAIAEQAPGGLSGDDLTMLLFRPNGLGPIVPLGRRLAAPFRMIAAFTHALLPGGPPFPWPEMSVRNIGGALFARLGTKARKY